MKVQFLFAIIAIAAINASSVYEIVAFENAEIQAIFAKGTRAAATISFSAGDMQTATLTGICNTCTIKGNGQNICTKMACSNWKVEAYVIAAVQNYLMANTKGGQTFQLEFLQNKDGEKIFLEATN